MRRLVLALALVVAPRLLAQRVPLNDLGSARYLGFQGGLYEAGINVPPADHAAAGLAAAARVVPRTSAGDPSPAGKIALISIGMSNTTQEFCSGSGTACSAWSFVGQALADPAVDRKALVLVNGAMGGQAADAWDSPSETNYTETPTPTRCESRPRTGRRRAQCGAAGSAAKRRRRAAAVP